MTYDIIGQNYDIIGQNYDIIVSTMISGVPRFQMFRVRTGPRALPVGPNCDRDHLWPGPPRRVGLRIN